MNADVMKRSGSSKPRRQRKWLFEKPLHSSFKDFSAHLAKELRGRIGKRSIELRTGDTVKVMRGSKAIVGKQGKVTALLRGKRMVLVEGIMMKKSDGSERQVPLRPSNLLAISLEEKDSRRLKGSKSKEFKAAAAPKEQEVKNNGK